MRIAIIDTYYPEFLGQLTLGTRTYEEGLQATLALCFGTHSAYSNYLQKLGHETIDVIANFKQLQDKWCSENAIEGASPQEVALYQIRKFKPDVVFLQDVSFFGPLVLKMLSQRCVIAAQISCPMPAAENVQHLRCIVSSFPHYVEKFKEAGHESVYLPLAFDPRMWSQHQQVIRTIDCAFIGGVGTPGHWQYGMEVLEAVAGGIPTAKFYGYGYEQLSAISPVAQKYSGPSFGQHMYQILGKSKIGLNRHGEVAGPYANNLKMFETTGMGALLVTEEKDNIRDFFAEDECVTYTSPEDAVEKIRYYLAHDDEREAIAAKGQQRTLRDHGYANRMPVVSEVLKGLINERL